MDRARQEETVAMVVRVDKRKAKTKEKSKLMVVMPDVEAREEMVETVELVDRGATSACITTPA